MHRTMCLAYQQAAWCAAVQTRALLLLSSHFSASSEHGSSQVPLEEDLHHAVEEALPVLSDRTVCGILELGSQADGSQIPSDMVESALGEARLRSTQGICAHRFVRSALPLCQFGWNSCPSLRNLLGLFIAQFSMVQSTVDILQDTLAVGSALGGLPNLPRLTLQRSFATLLSPPPSSEQLQEFSYWLMRVGERSAVVWNMLLESLAQAPDISATEIVLVLSHAFFGTQSYSHLLSFDGVSVQTFVGTNETVITRLYERLVEACVRKNATDLPALSTEHQQYLRHLQAAMRKLPNAPSVWEKCGVAALCALYLRPSSFGDSAPSALVELHLLLECHQIALSTPSAICPVADSAIAAFIEQTVLRRSFSTSVLALAGWNELIAAVCWASQLRPLDPQEWSIVYEQLGQVLACLSSPSASLCRSGILQCALLDVAVLLEKHAAKGPLCTTSSGLPHPVCNTMLGVAHALLSAADQQPHFVLAPVAYALGVLSPLLLQSNQKVAELWAALSRRLCDALRGGKLSNTSVDALCTVFYTLEACCVASSNCSVDVVSLTAALWQCIEDVGPCGNARRVTLLTHCILNLNSTLLEGGAYTTAKLALRWWDFQDEPSLSHSAHLLFVGLFGAKGTAQRILPLSAAMVQTAEKILDAVTQKAQLHVLQQLPVSSQYHILQVLLACTVADVWSVFRRSLLLQMCTNLPLPCSMHLVVDLHRSRSFPCDDESLALEQEVLSRLQSQITRLRDAPSHNPASAAAWEELDGLIPLLCNLTPIRAAGRIVQDNSCGPMKVEAGENLRICRQIVRVCIEDAVPFLLSRQFKHHRREKVRARFLVAALRSAMLYDCFQEDAARCLASIQLIASDIQSRLAATRGAPPPLVCAAALGLLIQSLRSMEATCDVTWSCIARTLALYCGNAAKGPQVADGLVVLLSHLNECADTLESRAECVAPITSLLAAAPCDVAVKALYQSTSPTHSTALQDLLVGGLVRSPHLSDSNSDKIARMWDETKARCWRPQEQPVVRRSESTVSHLDAVEERLLALD